MRGYVKRVTQKIDKFSKEQLASLLGDMASEIENYDSIMESLSAGIIIVDKDYRLLQSNRVSENQLNFSAHLDDTNPGTVPLWELIDDADIADFIKAYCNAWQNYSGNYFGLSFKNNLDDNRILTFDKTLMKVCLMQF